MSPMNNRLLVPRKTPGLLDLVPGAAAAYSLRSLSNSYADPVVTVRRSSDDDEAPFTASEVSDGALAAFCGAGDGLVTKWWDQSGYERHGSQTTPTYQPKIVSSGSVVLEEGKPALQFDGIADFFTAPGLLTFSEEANKAVFFVGAAGNNANRVRALFIGVGNSTRVSLFKENQTSYGWTGDAYANAVFANAVVDSQHLHYASDYNGSQSLTIDAGIASTNALGGTNTGSDTAEIGRGGTGQWWDGSMQEMILYADNVNAVSDLIIGNIAWSYSV